MSALPYFKDVDAKSYWASKYQYRDRNKCFLLKCGESATIICNRCEYKFCVDHSNHKHWICQYECDNYALMLDTQNNCVCCLDCANEITDQINDNKCKTCYRQLESDRTTIGYCIKCNGMWQYIKQYKSISGPFGP